MYAYKYVYKCIIYINSIIYKYISIIAPMGYMGNVWSVQVVCLLRQILRSVLKIERHIVCVIMHLCLYEYIL